MPAPPEREDEDGSSSFSDKPLGRKVRRRVRRRYDDDDDEEQVGAGEEAVSTIIPYKNPKALISYYLGVFGLIPCVGLILGPAALILGILGLRYKRTHPRAKGTGHAIAGIVLGSLEILVNWGMVLIQVLLFSGVIK